MVSVDSDYLSLFRIDLTTVQFQRLTLDIKANVRQNDQKTHENEKKSFVECLKRNGEAFEC